MPAISIKMLPNFADTRILVIGDVMLDRYWFGDTARVSPEAPVPIVSIRHMDQRPGGAANVALNIAALGAKTILIGCVGQDEAANTLKHRLESTEIETLLCMEPHLTTIIKLRVISRHQQLIRLDFEEDLSQFSFENVLTIFKQHIHRANVLVLSDYQKGTLQNIPKLIEIARAAQVPILVDPKGADFKRYADATVITPNYKEFEAIVGPCHNEQNLLDKGRILLDELNIQALLITRSDEGMTLIQRDKFMHLPAYAREVFDVTGAGDTVIGTLAASMAAKLDLSEAMQLANLAASLAVSKLGAVSISAPELQSALSQNEKISAGIVNSEQLRKAVMEVRSKGKTVVFTNGCYDILHAGHVASLEMAKQLGDYLIVAVNADSSIKRLKGMHRPINHLEHRMKVIAGLGVVDWVIPFEEDTPEHLLHLLQPDFLVKGSDYQLDQVVGADIVRAYGGEVRIVKHDIAVSSSSIIQRLQKEGELR